MIRKIVNYQKLNKDILNLLVDKFPDGYSDKDIIAFRNAQNEYIEAVEVKTEDTVYLVKIGKRLVQAMEKNEEDEDDLNDNDSSKNTVDIDALNEEGLH
ncbi:MAG: hypothetical protein ACKVGT_07430 [Flavobacteriales bacterium]|jgi:hypothetical protein|nr:hypothetical protein [Ulvibacter sp.]|tara:strand:+ start:1756 stop:2052 length:297 start_codon:yes stop_codon:yes gene_type:complete